MTKLLIADHPLQVLPRLAAEIGLNEAIVLQQIHYWLEKSPHVHRQQKWVYNTMDDWLAQFPWIKSRKTLANYFAALADRHLLVTGNFNRSKFDRTKWYSIDYRTLQELAGRLGSPATVGGQKQPVPLSPAGAGNTKRPPADYPEREEEPFTLARQVGIAVDSQLHRPLFQKYLDLLGPALVCWALKQTADRAHHPNWRYLVNVLDSLRTAGVTSPDQADKIIACRYHGRSRRQRPIITREHRPAAPKIRLPQAMPTVPDDSREVMPND